MLMPQLCRRPWKEGENMNKGLATDFKDEIVEQIKDFGRIAKAQAVGDQKQEESGVSRPKKVDKIDPVTGKKPPTKQQLNNIQQQTAQLAQARLKKVREDLEKQRLKVTQEAQNNPHGGPEIKQEKKPSVDDAVQKTLKASKSTGEFKGLIGG